jgi:hypothetical protein
MPASGIYCTIKWYYVVSSFVSFAKVHRFFSISPQYLIFHPQFMIFHLIYVNSNAKCKKILYNLVKSPN